MITIFTATYNRKHTLDKLYHSLLLQSFTDFEWLIVDDGSTDNTFDLINEYITEGRIKIKYFKQINGGKHRAINNGLDLASRELFFIVDSDDSLTKDSLERIVFHYNIIKNDPSIAGVVGLMGSKTGKIIGGGLKGFDLLDTNLIERRYKYHLNGDMAKVLKTCIFRQFKFPDIENESFVAESIVWNRIALKYNFRYFNEVIYNTEYLEGGLSNNSIRNRRKNPEYACLLYKELFHNSLVPFKFKIKAMVNYWRFAFCRKQSIIGNFIEINSLLLNLITMPIGLVLYVKDNFVNNVKINNDEG